MSKVIKEISIKNEEKVSLQTSYIEYMALMELIKNNVVNDVVMERYTKAYDLYNKTWLNLLIAYDCSQYTVGNYNWECDFATNKIIITN